MNGWFVFLIVVFVLFCSPSEGKPWHAWLFWLLTILTIAFIGLADAGMVF